VVSRFAVAIRVLFQNTARQLIRRLAFGVTIEIAMCPFGQSNICLSTFRKMKRLIHLFQDFIKRNFQILYIVEQFKFDLIYWTGDLPPHNVWNQTRFDQISALKKLTSLFKKYFPKKLIMPSLGNHETQPCNL
jgi:hypothetical protein